MCGPPDMAPIKPRQRSQKKRKGGSCGPATLAADGLLILAKPILSNQMKIECRSTLISIMMSVEKWKWD